MGRTHSLILRGRTWISINVTITPVLSYSLCTIFTMAMAVSNTALKLRVLAGSFVESGLHSNPVK